MRRQIDNAGNIAPLPATRDAQQKLDSAGIKRPVHDGGHRKWDAEVARGLDAIQEELGNEGLSPDTDAYALRARKILERLQERLRKKLPGHDRLNWAVPVYAVSFA